MKRRKKKFSWGGLLYLLVILLFVVLLIVRWDDAARIAKTILQANLWYLFLALIVQLMIMINQAMFYRDSYRVFGLRVEWVRFFWVVGAANFLSMVSPSGGFVPGLALVLADGKKMNLSRGKIVIANVAYWVVNYSTFILFLVISLFFLLIGGGLTDYMLYPALFLFFLAAIFVTIMFLALDNYDRFKQVSIKMAQKFNGLNVWLGKKYRIDQRHIKKYSYEIYEGYHYVLNNIWSIKILIYRAIAMILLNVTILSLLVKSFGGDWLSIGFLVSCYVIAALLMVISITPSGAGVVELAMVSILSAQVIDFDKAVLVVVLYRLYQFWIPLLFGFISFRRIGGGLIIKIHS
ncbi:MAG: flippase-like domain-containing protein [Patescibacteria group bacterium]